MAVTIIACAMIVCAVIDHPCFSRGLSGRPPTAAARPLPTLRRHVRTYRPPASRDAALPVRADALSAALPRPHRAGGGVSRARGSRHAGAAGGAALADRPEPDG